MCLFDFEEFVNINEDNPLIGYRNWRLNIINSTNLRSEYQDYDWNKVIEGPHEVLDRDSGIHAYSDYNYYKYNYYYDGCDYSSYNNKYYKYYDNYNNYNYYNNYNNYNYYNNCNKYYNVDRLYKYYNCYKDYRIAGIILQFGKIAIHKIGNRSEYARIKTLFTIRELDAEGGNKFLAWIKQFNLTIEVLAEKYECNTMHWQDFFAEQK